MCNCASRIHSFACYLRNIATGANTAAMANGTSINTDTK